MGVRGRAAMAALVLAVAACGADEEPGRAQAPTTTEARPVEAQPFTVTSPPPGYVARSAGAGSQEPVWGEDCCGTDEPYVVLSPDGTADHGEVVLVSITGYRGYQGGLDQASNGIGEIEEVEVDGEPARFAPAGSSDGPAGRELRWADLVVAQGDADVAIRVTSPHAGFDELAAIVEHVVVPADRTQPPTVPDPPAGLEVVGAVDARAVIAGQAHADPRAPGGPGPATALGIGWLGASEPLDQVAVVRLPGAPDLAALEVGLRWQALRWGGTVTPRPEADAVLVEQVYGPDEGGGAERRVWTVGPDGDLVVATAFGVDPPTLDELLAVAASVEPVDAATWEAFVSEVRGGPGLRADPGRTELARGTTPDGRGWLLQDQPPGEGNLAMSGEGGGWSVDPCLVLDGRERACPSTEGEQPGLWRAEGRIEDGPAFHVVATTWPEVAALLVSTDGGTEVVPLVSVPGTDERTAAVVGEGYVLDACQEAPVPPSAPHLIRLATADGSVAPCPAP